MKLSDILSQYAIDTTKASDLCRQSNYSLIAVCWILANESVDKVLGYRIVLLFVIMSLFFDFIQYFYRGIVEGRHYDSEESNAKDDLGKINEEYDAKPYPISINKISTGIYYAKVGCTLLAFLLLMWRLM